MTLLIQEALVLDPSTTDLQALKKRLYAEKKLAELKRKRQANEDQKKREKEEETRRAWLAKSQEEETQRHAEELR